ncbi:MAG TPA: flavoprotein [Kofleriaceae bacterium]|nr:flavoprotein [Kofleriaceae bacterium]
MSSEIDVRWVRSHRAAAVDVGERLVLLGGAAGGAVDARAIEGDGAAVARELLGFCAVPRSVGEIVEHVVALSGGEPVHTQRIVAQLVELLRAAGAIVQARSAERPQRGNVVVCVSGAVAASHAPAFVTAMQRRGWRVECALTEAAPRFVAVDALEAVLQRAVHVGMWPAAPHVPVPHVALAEWADLLVVYPASATTIARIAHGDFGDLVAATALTTRAPVVLVPSMNGEMMAAAAVERNLEQLRGDGFAIVHGVPSEEAADAPAVRREVAAAAPAPGEAAATIDALAEMLAKEARPTKAWDAAYRRALVPWASEACDADVAAALVHHAPPPGRLLDVGCGLGQVARHAAGLGYRVVATDVSEVALSRARRERGGDEVVWVRDDICASALVGPFDVIVDRAVMHVLPAARVGAWAAAIRRVAAPHATVIVKAHADKAARVAKLTGFQVVEEIDGELPGIVDATPIASRLVVLRR